MDRILLPCQTEKCLSRGKENCFGGLISSGQRLDTVSQWGSPGSPGVFVKPPGEHER